ncbi:hypothetical protein RCH33_204 [Flavobacterium daejeonense]|nr:hypothetical protein RCH33_204 [Flavobacterium daejeonense]
MITFRLSSFVNCLFRSSFFSKRSIKPVTAPPVSPVSLEISPALNSLCWIISPKYLWSALDKPALRAIASCIKIEASEYARLAFLNSEIILLESFLFIC